MNYCMRWTEEETFRICTAKVVMDFLEEHIVTKFRMLFTLVCDNESTFTLVFLTQWAFEN